MDKAFNNLMVWRLVEPIHLDAVALNEALAERRAGNPTAGQMTKTGFIPPLAEDDCYVETLGAAQLIAINTAKRLLPGKVVRGHVERKAREIEKAEGRKVFAREKQRMKEEVIETLLKHAFIDHSQVYALLMGPYIFLGVSSVKRGEALLDCLREAVGSLKVVPVAVQRTPIHHYTRWFSEGVVTDSDKFTLGSQFSVHGTTSESEAVKGSWPFSTDDTLSDWVAQGGQKVTAIGLHWHADDLDHEVPFVVNEMLGVKSLKWPPEIVDMARDDAGEDADDYGMARATVLMLSHEMSRLWQDLLDALGGEAIPNGASQHEPEPDADDEDDNDLI